MYSYTNGFFEQSGVDHFQQLDWKSYNAYLEVLIEELDLRRETLESVLLNGVLKEKLQSSDPDVSERRIIKLFGK